MHVMDLQTYVLMLGYNFLNNKDGNYHLGTALYAAAPTGSRIGEGKNGHYLMEPIIGNGKHWELGVQITAHHLWWRSADDDNSFGLYLEANITHFFDAWQTRCFDLLSGGNNSRYIIAQRLAPNSTMNPTLSPTADPQGLSFANEYAPVANITRRTVTSSIAAQGDIAFMLAYQVHDFRWELGYNFWARSREKLCIQKDNCSANIGTWAVKGDERVYGFVNQSTAQSLAIPLAVTDSQATIYAGSNMQNSVDYTPLDPSANNFYADNITLAGSNITTLPENDVQIYTSQTPVIIQQSDFYLGETRSYSNKLFTHFNWAWTERQGTKWVPYLGVGAEVEFGSSSKTVLQADCSLPICAKNICSRPVNTCADKCINFALSQWGIWLKVGSSYN